MSQRKYSALKPGDRVQVKPMVMDVNERYLAGGRLCTVLDVGNSRTEYETLALIDKSNVLIVVYADQVEFLQHAEVSP